MLSTMIVSGADTWVNVDKIGAFWMFGEYFYTWGWFFILNKKN